MAAINATLQNIIEQRDRIRTIERDFKRNVPSHRRVQGSLNVRRDVTSDRRESRTVLVAR